MGLAHWELGPLLAGVLVLEVLGAHVMVGVAVAVLCNCAIIVTACGELFTSAVVIRETALEG